MFQTHGEPPSNALLVQQARGLPADDADGMGTKQPKRQCEQLSNALRLVQQARGLLTDDGDIWATDALLDRLAKRQALAANAQANLTVQVLGPACTE
jgi:hypothetical protein